MRPPLHYRRRRHRPANLLPDIAQLFARRPYLPLVKYDPAFAAWQSQYQPPTARWLFARLRKQLEQ